MNETYLVKKNDLVSVADAIRTASATSRLLEFPNGCSLTIETLGASGFRMVTPLSKTENVTVDSAVLAILRSKTPEKLRANAERMTEYILIQATIESLNFKGPIVAYGDIDSTQLLAMSGTKGKVVYSFVGGSTQADTNESGDMVVITPAVLSDLEDMVTAFIRQAFGSDTLEVVYSDPVHVVMYFEDKNS